MSVPSPSSQYGWCPHRSVMWDWCQIGPVKPEPHLAFNLQGDWWTWRQCCRAINSRLRLPPRPFTEPALLVLRSQDASRVSESSSSLCTLFLSCDVNIATKGEVVLLKACVVWAQRLGVPLSEFRSRQRVLERIKRTKLIYRRSRDAGHPLEFQVMAWGAVISCCRADILNVWNLSYGQQKSSTEKATESTDPLNSVPNHQWRLS